jgi:hypothetical protein
MLIMYIDEFERLNTLTDKAMNDSATRNELNELLFHEWDNFCCLTMMICQIRDRCLVAIACITFCAFYSGGYIPVIIKVRLKRKNDCGILIITNEFYCSFVAYFNLQLFASLWGFIGKKPNLKY